MIRPKELVRHWSVRPNPSDPLRKLFSMRDNVDPERLREDVAAREAEKQHRVDELASLSAHLSAATARWLELVWEMREQGDSERSAGLCCVALRNHGA